MNPLWISQSDCLNDDVFTIPLTVTGYAGYALEVWIGDGSTDCTTTAARQATTASCWNVNQGSAISESITLNVRARDVVGRHLPPAGPGSGTQQDCSPSAATDGGPVKADFFFMFIDPSDNSSGGGTLLKIAYDLVPPQPPTLAEGGSATSPIQVSWTAPSASDLWGFAVYCDPPPGSESATAADPASCKQSKLQAGSQGPNDLLNALVKGPAATGASVSGVRPGDHYSIGVAAIDSVGNHSNLSNVTCASAKAAAASDEAANDSGGCATGPGSGTRASLASLVLASLAAAILLRRKRG